MYYLVYSIFRDGGFQLPHRAIPEQRDVFSEMYILTGLGGIMLTGIDSSASVVWTDISSIFIATSNLFVDMTCKN